MVTIASAGPTGAPAAVLHPDQPLPTCWQVFSEWEHAGQRGAWLIRSPDDGWRAGEEPVVQVVYREEGSPGPGRYLGHILKASREALSCYASDRSSYHFDRSARAMLAMEQRHAYYAERGIDIERRDWWALRLWKAAGSPDDEAAYSYDPTPDPGPTPADDDTLQECPPAAIGTLELDPSQEWPPEWQPFEHSGQLWAHKAPARWYPIRYRPGAKVLTVAGLRSSISGRRRRMMNAVYEAQHPKQPAAAAATASEAVIDPPRPLSSPPGPGIDRARWLGEQITDMMPRTKYLGWSAHARRRYAARLALAKVGGYDATDPDHDARILLASASLELQALNEYAGRVFSGQEDSDAVL